MLNGALPTLETVTSKGALELVWAVSGNITGLGLKVKAGVAANEPLPVRLTEYGLSMELFSIKMLPLLTPTAEGSNHVVTVHACPFHMTDPKQSE